MALKFFMKKSGENNMPEIEDIVYTKEDIFKELLKCVKWRVIHPNYCHQLNSSGVRGKLYQRLQSLIFAFNVTGDSSCFSDLLMSFMMGSCLDQECSKDKQAELLMLTERDFDDMDLRKSFFSSLLCYYLVSDRYEPAYGGLLECSKEYYAGVSYARKVNDVVNQLISEKVLRVLLLLLGDKYDRTFTKKELCEKYHFPTDSEESIHEMIMEECCLD